MALPSVTIKLSEETFRPSSGEASSPFVAGAVLSDTTLIKALGTTAEVTQQYIHFKSLQDLNSRLTLNSGNSAGFDFPGFSGGQGASYAISSSEVRFPNGPTGSGADADLRQTFHNVESAAQYGSQVIAGVCGSDPFTSSSIALNCIFDGDGSSDDGRLLQIQIQNIMRLFMVKRNTFQMLVQ